jgi:hypothetical protein
MGHLAQPMINLEAEVDKLFYELEVAHQAAEIWNVGLVEGTYGMVSLEQESPASDGIQ